MNKVNAKIKIGGETMRLSLPAEQERVYHMVGQELDRLYYVYKTRYPKLKEKELYATIAYVVLLQKAGVNLKDSSAKISYRQLRWRAFLAPILQFFRQCVSNGKVKNAHP